MTDTPETNQVQQQNDKELNFRALQNKYERALQEANNARVEAERKAEEALRRQPMHVDEDDDDSSEPYVDHKRLNKTLAKHEQKFAQQTQTEIQKAVQQAIQNERRENWLKNNPDFYDILQHAEKFAQHDPELAETILSMPEGFERQKLVYKNIKALGIHKPTEKVETIQSKVDANRRTPYYQPGGMGNIPYSSSSDFSQSGQKQGYEKMQELKSRLRL